MEFEFACSICGYKSFIKGNVKRHITKTDPCGEGIREIVTSVSKTSPQFSCKFCNLTFTTKQSLEYHIDNNVCKKTKSVNVSLLKEIEELKKKTEELQLQLSTIILSKEKTVFKSARKAIPSSVRNKLWANHFEKSTEGKCTVCESDINITNFHASHIISVKQGGTNNITNLTPSCSNCNQSMYVQNLDEFKKEYF